MHAFYLTLTFLLVLGLEDRDPLLSLSVTLFFVAIKIFWEHSNNFFHCLNCLKKA